MYERLIHLGEVVMDGANAIGENFTDADDDWQLVFFVVEKDDEISVLRAPNWLANDRGPGKDVFAEVLARVVEVAQPREMGMVSGAWMQGARCKLCGRRDPDPIHYGEEPECPFEPDEDTIPSLDKPMPRDDPNRVEAVIVCAWNGEASVQWVAKVDRHEGRPPTKGPWLTTGPYEHPENVPTLGRWMDATVPVLREVAA